MSRLDGTGRSLADNLFTKKMEQISAQQQEKIVAIRSDHVRRNMTMSGMHMMAQVKVLAEQIKLLGQAKAEALLTAYKESGIPLDASSITEITTEVLNYCRAQQNGAINAMHNVILQTFQRQAPPNLEEAVIQGLNTLVHQVCAGISRDLRITRDQAELAKKRIARDTEKVVPEGVVRDERKTWDVFICHASEDKDSFVRPLAEALSESIKVWYDEMTLTVGDSLRQKIDHGLANSRFGVVVLSKAFFSKNWPQAELDGLMSREMAGTHIKVILPVWHGVSREDVLAYSPILSGRLAADSKEGLDSVVAKLHAAMRTGATSPSRISARQEIEREPREYYEQRRALPDSAIVNEILTKSHWRISIFPIEFKKARFRNLDQCGDFVSSSCVRSSSGIIYPQFRSNTLEIGSEYIACDTAASEWPPSHLERWVLFRSGLFVQNRVFNEKQQLGGRIHALEVLDITTAAFEFATRMSQHVALAPEIVVSCGLHGVEGRQLAWPQDIFLDDDAVGRNCWCQEEKIDLTRQMITADIAAHRRELAFNVAMEIYSRFGWLDAPIDRLKHEQESRFSSA
jgi:hypothetical protein